MAQAIIKRTTTPTKIAPKSSTSPAIITQSGPWVVPAKVTSIRVFLVGGGGGGMSFGSRHASPTGWTAYGHGGGGGAGGKTLTVPSISVTPGQIFICEIGKGGYRGSYAEVEHSFGDRWETSAAGDGGTTRFGSYSVGGGAGASSESGASGGSGGGGAGGKINGVEGNYWFTSSGSGGTDGNPGGSQGGISGGSGQNSTTRAFGRSGGILFAGGGGGGADWYDYDSAYHDEQYGTGKGGVGGAGGGYTSGNGGGNGGGTGSTSYQEINGTAGTPNTGSGGGGGTGCHCKVGDDNEYQAHGAYGGAGGSGIIIVEWD